MPMLTLAQSTLRATPTEALSDEDAQDLLDKHLFGWEITHTDDEADILRRHFKLNDFPEALHFIAQVGDLAQIYGHLPRITLNGATVTVDWWNAALGGLEINDFIMAAKTQAAYEDWPSRQSDDPLHADLHGSFPASDPPGINL
ncbi:MAG: 4a-hydroxytetrahydrobiopterin dehydratase [Anaerolineales bacterium]